MRLYCLTSVSQIPPDNNYEEPTPYNEDADELSLAHGFPIQGHYGSSCRSTLEKLTADYRLTEICIGYKTFEEDEERRIYVIEFYRKNSYLITFKMLRSFVTLTYLNEEKNCFVLRLATSKMPQLHSSSPTPDFDLNITVLCIRNTSTRGLVTVEEEEAYINHAKRINDFCKENSQMEIETLQKEIIQRFGSLTLPNQSTLKVFKQKLTDFQTAIDLLCDPKTGSFKNINVNSEKLNVVKPPQKRQKLHKFAEKNPDKENSSNSRINQKAECLLYMTESRWCANKPREPLENEMDKFRYTPELRWKNVIFDNRTNFDAFNFQHLCHISLEKVYLGKSMEFWHKLAAKINFSKVVTISLRDCKIKALDDKFFEILSPKLGALRLVNNNIEYISKEITKLINLSVLDLNGNINLTDCGIPWDELPLSIYMLNLVNTDIKEIPNEFQGIAKIKELNVSRFRSNLHDSHTNDVKLKDIRANRLTLSNVKFAELHPSRTSISSLHLINNGLKNFNLADTNYRHLYELTISKNGLKTFSWNNLPKRLQRLDLSHNRLETVVIHGVFSHFGYRNPLLLGAGKLWISTLCYCNPYLKLLDSRVTLGFLYSTPSYILWDTVTLC